MTIAELAAKYEQYVIDMRREFHENPELSHHEERTVRRIREELADVLSYCVLMADVCGLDLDEILNAKVDQNAAKYPVEKARGSAAKYTELT